jgi:outer membrane protein OmpA-like peptidoglycan-associated protein
VGLSLDENYKILIETSPTKLTDEADYYIENLELVTSVKESPTIVYEPIHFDFGKDQLTVAAKNVLNGLVVYFQQNPTIQIELNAYTDKAGSDSYNQILSQKRGDAVREYLIAQGLPVSGISVKAHGKRTVLPSKNHSDSLDRSVEFIIRGAQQNATDEAEMVVLSAQTSLKVIAEKFEMSLNELQALNGFMGEQVEPYRPIKVKRR